MSKLLGMLPGANSAAMKKQIEGIDDNELTRTQSIVQSMTPLERRDPKVLNGSRRARIAKGAGRQVSEVNNLVDRFTQAQKVMKQMRNGGGLPNIPGMGAIPGMPAMPAARKPGHTPPKKKSRSGNPAKRAAEES
jgi:signal recognition particle subunit SRP54